jgi:PAS domain S-box-containing protein
MIGRDNFVYGLASKPHALALAILVLFLLFFGAGYYNWRHDFSQDLEAALDSDKTAANLLADLLSEHERATLGVLQSYANRPLFVEAVKRRDFDGTISHLAQLVRNHKKIDIVFVADVNGVLWASYPFDDSPLNQNFSYRDWYRGVTEGWKPYVSSLYRRLIGSNELAVASVTPIFDGKGQPVGILANPQSVSFLASIIRQVPFGEHTRVTLLDQAGYTIYSNGSSPAGEIRAHPHFDFIDKAVREGRYLIETQYSKGANHATLAPLKDMGWILIVERSGRDTLITSLKHFAATGASYLLFFLILSLCLFYMRKAFQLAETTELLYREGEALRDSEQRFQTLFKRHNAVMLLIDPDSGRILDANSAAVQFYGYSWEQLSSMNIGDINQLESSEIARERERARQEERNYFVFPHRLAGGEVRTVEVYSTPIDVQRQRVLFSVIHDITDRKKAEEELLRHREHLETLVEERTTEVEEKNRLLIQDITKRKEAEEDRERLILELREAISKIKTLSGLLPICASCKKIRNDKGYWEQMEIYIRDHSEADFSHGICPECAEKLYPDYYKKG